MTFGKTHKVGAPEDGEEVDALGRVGQLFTLFDLVHDDGKLVLEVVALDVAVDSSKRLLGLLNPAPLGIPSRRLGKNEPNTDGETVKSEGSWPWSRGRATYPVKTHSE